MFNSKVKILISFTALSIISALGFQNCAPSAFEPQQTNSQSSQYGNGSFGGNANLPDGFSPPDYTDAFGNEFAFGGTTAVGCAYGGTYPYCDEIGHRNLSINLNECTADDSRLAFEVYGLGPNAVSCAESYIPGRDPGVCTDDKFVRLADLRPDWTYTPETDVWTVNQKLQNHKVFVPGKYKALFRKNPTSATFAVDLELKSAVNSKSCAKVSSTPKPLASSCQLSDIQKQIAECEKSNFACYVIDEVSKESLYYQVGFGPATRIVVNCGLKTKPAKMSFSVN